jgi:hypothetical protein
MSNLGNNKQVPRRRHPLTGGEAAGKLALLQPNR